MSTKTQLVIQDEITLGCQVRNYRKSRRHFKKASIANAIAISSPKKKEKKKKKN